MPLYVRGGNKLLYDQWLVFEDSVATSRASSSCTSLRNLDLMTLVLAFSLSHTCLFALLTTLQMSLWPSLPPGMRIAPHSMHDFVQTWKEGLP